MKTLWDPEAREELRDRLGRLTPSAERRWGRMSASQMVAHLVDSLRMANGEIRVPSANMPLRYTPIKQLIIYVAPFPKGAPTSPQLISRTPGDWPAECRALGMLMDQFAARGQSAQWPDHPAFGKLTPRAWGVLSYRHMDHHLKQFGV